MNDLLGLTVTNAVGTMWAAYAFTGLALVSLPASLRTHDPVVIVGWIAQTFLQLVLLPIIIVGQRLQSRTADDRAEQVFLDAEAILHEAAETHRHLDLQDADLDRLRSLLTTIHDLLNHSTGRAAAESPQKGTTLP